MKRIVPVTRNVLLIVLSIHFLLVTFLVPHTSPLLLTKDELGHFPFVIPNPASSTTASLDGQHAPTPSSSLGAIVLLAPQRNKRGYGHVRTCLLRNALQSIDVYLNAHHGPYDVYVLVASDYILDPERRDGPYSDADRAALQAELNHTNLTFVEIKMYSDEALEPNLDMRQFVRWNQGLDGGTAGRNIGYRSMCRLWSGRLQHMEFMKRYKYYIRMDDDSHLTSAPQTDPFLDMEENGWKYAYRQGFFEAWGYEFMWEIAEKLMSNETKDDMVRMGWLIPPHEGKPYRYIGAEPYNNFHAATIAMWSDPRWLDYLTAVEAEYGFFKHRFGDANIHAIAMGMLLKPNEVGLMNHFPYVHNINGMPAYHYKLKNCDAQLEAEVKVMRSDAPGLKARGTGRVLPLIRRKPK